MFNEQSKASRESILSWLLEKATEESVNLADNDGTTTLHLAVEEGQNLTVTRLLEKGAKGSVNSADKNGKTPLHMAVETKKDDTLLRYPPGQRIIDLLKKAPNDLICDFQHGPYQVEGAEKVGSTSQSSVDNHKKAPRILQRTYESACSRRLYTRRPCGQYEEE
jgi:ankyrin repeat protein